MLALLLGNAFIVGINQIYDVDIDRVNKPFLPVAAAELSVRRSGSSLPPAPPRGPSSSAASSRPSSSASTPSASSSAGLYR